jgi:hypothetical protein
VRVLAGIVVVLALVWLAWPGAGEPLRLVAADIPEDVCGYNTGPMVSTYYGPDTIIVPRRLSQRMRFYRDGAEWVIETWTEESE